MSVQPFRHSPDRDLRRPPVRKAEDAGRDTAEGNAPDPVPGTEIQRVRVAVRQVLFEFLRQGTGYNRPHDMDHFPSGKVVPVRQHGHSGRLLIVPAVLCPELIHLPAAFRPELDPRKGMNAVCDTL